MPKKFSFKQGSLFILTVSLFALSCKQPDAVAVADNELPEENRFTKVVLTEGMDEPMEMSFLDKGRVLIIERKGVLKVFDPSTNQVKVVAHIPVNTKYTTKEGAVSEAEEGLVGLIVHPKFAENHWIYVLCRSFNAKACIGKMGTAWRFFI